MTRRYPDRPVAGVGAVVLTAAGEIVLVQRGQPPLEGRWSVPGGAVELGESLDAAIRREVEEETHLVVRVGPVVHALDRITRDAAGRVEYHYVLVDFLCLAVGGTLRAGTDAAAVAAVRPDALDAFDLAPETLAVIRRGVELRSVAQF